MFEIWKLKRARKKAHDSYDPKFKEAKARNASFEEMNGLEYDRYRDSQHFDEAIDLLVGRRLADEARELDVPVPLMDEEGMWTRGDKVEELTFTSQGRAHLRKLIDDEKARRFEVKTLWVTKLVLPMLAASIGIIGAITGLVAVLRHTK